MKVLAIETSCDETAIALVSFDKQKNGLPKPQVLKSVISSQVRVHAPFGGVVPTLAKREHIKNLPLLWEKFLKHPAIAKKKIDLLTVTVGPGLEPALWAGITFAKKLHEEYFEKKIPLLGANHLHGHLYSFLLAKKQKNAKSLFPMTSLVVSGGHTILGILQNAGTFKKLGETKDDAIGECFDKVARLLKLPYPGGPYIERMAQRGNRHAITFPSPMLNQKNYDFSYSGLKTAVLYYLRDTKRPASKADIAASFQEAACKVLVAKTKRASEAYGARSVAIGGGVAANKTLRNMLRKELPKKIPCIIPPFAYCTDNAVMIAIAGYMARMNNTTYPLEANGTMDL